MKRTEKVPEGSILLTADVACLYPTITHKERVLALKNKLELQRSSKISTNNFVKLAEFVLKNIFFNLATKLSNNLWHCYCDKVQYSRNPHLYGKTDRFS